MDPVTRLHQQKAEVIVFGREMDDRLRELPRFSLIARFLAHRATTRRIREIDLEIGRHRTIPGVPSQRS